VQDEIAAAIAEALRVRLSLAPGALRRYTPNLPAYEAYLRARHHWAKATPESLARSREYYEQAIALDPGFALAHIGLADYFLLLAGAALLPANDAMPLVRACAQKALEIDPSLPEAHAVLGVVAGLYDYDWKEAERLFRLAMARDPVSPQVHVYYGFYYLQPVGRLEDAVKELDRVLQKDPLNILARVVLGDCLGQAGRHEDASMEYLRVLELDENYWYACARLAVNYALRGMLTEALTFAEKAYSLAPWNSMAMAFFAAVLVRAGNESRAEEVLQNLRSAPEAYGAPRALAIFHFLCGEIDHAADWAAKAIEQRDCSSPIMFAFFQSSARWPALAKMMNLPVSVS
jgi:tetratricopeptide (TPR) repeat protein